MLFRFVGVPLSLCFLENGCSVSRFAVWRVGFSQDFYGLQFLENYRIHRHLMKLVHDYIVSYEDSQGGDRIQNCLFWVGKFPVLRLIG